MVGKTDKNITSNRKFFNFTGLEVTDFFKDCRPLLKTSAATLLYQNSSNQVFGKLLVIAGRKVGNACARNRLRRLAKAIFLELALQQFAVKIVLILRQKCMLDRLGLEKILNQAKERLG